MLCLFRKSLDVVWETHLVDRWFGLLLFTLVANGQNYSKNYNFYQNSLRTKQVQSKSIEPDIVEV